MDIPSFDDLPENADWLHQPQAQRPQPGQEHDRQPDRSGTPAIARAARPLPHTADHGGKEQPR